MSVAATENQIHVAKCQAGTLPENKTNENKTETVEDQVIKMIT